MEGEERVSHLDDLLKKILAFRDARDWEQFHTPRNLAAALAIEAAELQEVMLWKTEDEVRELLDSPKITRLEEELGDVLIFALLLADAIGVDPAEAVRRKLQENAAKYPEDQARGRADKYTELQDGDE